MNLYDISPLLVAVGTLMVVTNIITEVLKKVTWNKLPTNLLVVIIAELLTLSAGAACSQLHSISIVWYHIVAAVVVGLFVAYAAMFGFDKLQQMVMQRGAMQ